ncbi:MAG: nuclear transport factor 2 family protein [Bacteroidia bacterium]
MRKYLFTLIFSATFYSCKQKQAPLTEAEVLNVINRFDNGWEHKNMKEVDSVLSPSYIYFTRSGGTFSRDSVVATAGESSYSLRDMSRTEIEATIYDNTAIVSTRWKGKGMYRGNPFDEDQRCSIVVVKDGDKVEILSEHCTPIQETKVFH